MPLLVRRHVRQLLVLAFVVFKCIPDAKYKFCSCTEATLGECQKIGTKLTDWPVLMTCCVSIYLILYQVSMSGCAVCLADKLDTQGSCCIERLA